MTFHRFAFVVCFVLGIVSAGCEGRRSIPRELEECYRTDGRAPGIPATFRTFLDILRKAERRSATFMDARTFSASLLHRFKFDGIKYSGAAKRHANDTDVLPFAATGPQRKRQELVERAIPGNPWIFPAEALSSVERCALHRFLSNTIDEEKDVSLLEECAAIEHGVIETAYGTVAPGAVVAAVAGALQPQLLSLRDLLEPAASSFLENRESLLIDNVYLATLAGDLAEVAVYQGILDESAMTLGVNGSWISNEATTFPRFYCHSRRGSYDATRAEILGDVDGLVLASKVVTWFDNFRGIRLSQILDGYYSEKGVSLDVDGTPPTRACDRARNFHLTVPKTLLEEQTFAASRLLIAQHGAPAYVTDEALARITARAVETFYAYSREKLREGPSTASCPTSETPGRMKKPTVEAILILDPRRYSPESIAQSIRSLIDRLDVSAYGSKLGMLDGATAEWLLNVTDSPAFVHCALSSRLPGAASFPANHTLVLERISDYLENVWERHRRHRAIGNLGQAVVSFLSPANMTKEEESSALESLKRIKLRHPDVYFVYCATTSNGESFRAFILTEDDRLILDCLTTDELAVHLREVAKTLRPAPQSRQPLNETSIYKYQFEDYASPSSAVIVYRIHRQWRRRTKSLTIHGFGYGTLEICRWTGSRPPHHEAKSHEAGRGEFFPCERLAAHETVDLTTYVSRNDSCLSSSSNDSPCGDLYFRVRAVSSLRKCAEIDCRFPDEVRYVVRSEPLRQRNSATLLSFTSSPLLLHGSLFLATAYSLQTFSLFY